MSNDVNVTDKHVLPSMELKFTYQGQGQETGISWAGDFVYVRPNLGDRTNIDVLEKRMNGDLFTIDDVTRLTNKALSHLRFTLKKYPAWWKESNFGQDLYDRNVVTEIYTKCVDFEIEWKQRVHGGDPKQVKEGESGGDSTTA